MVVNTSSPRPSGVAASQGSALPCPTTRRHPVPAPATARLGPPRGPLPTLPEQIELTPWRPPDPFRP